MPRGRLSRQDTREFRGHTRDIVNLANVLATAVADLPQKRSILQKLLECVGQCQRVGGRDRQPGPGLHEFRRAASGCGDDRNSVSHRLHKRHRYSFMHASAKVGTGQHDRRNRNRFVNLQ